MKEIKCNIVSQCGNSDGLYKIEVKPLERIYGPLNCGKTYKLVEDEAIGNQISDCTIFTYSPYISQFSIEDRVDEWLKANPNISPLDKVGFAVGVDLGKPSSDKTLSHSFIVPAKVKRVMFNGNATILEIGDFKTVVKCHEDDQFSYVTGLGLALYRYYKKQPSTKKDFKNLSFYMNYDGLAEYCFEKYFNFDKKRIWNFLKNCNKGKWLELWK